jgi:hypothetical protein
MSIKIGSAKSVIRAIVPMPPFNCPLQVNKLIKGNESKKLVYKDLSELRRCRNKEEFEVMLDSFVRSIDGDFHEYFMKYYYHRSEMWAVCYRRPDCPDTNAHAESFHRVLKHVAFAGKRNRKVRALIEALLDLETDYFIKSKTYAYCLYYIANLISNLRISRKGTAQDLMGISRILRSTIKASTKIEDSAIDLVEDATIWSVISSRDPDAKYFVVRSSSVCAGRSASSDPEEFEPESTGNGPCVSYKISKSCRHIFSCGCRNYANGHTCKHILKISASLRLWDPCRATLHTNDNLHAPVEEFPTVDSHADDSDCGLQSAENNTADNYDNEPAEDTIHEQKDNINLIRNTLSVSSSHSLVTKDV